ncbi:MAG: MFS transporter [Candidatus Hodarchaeales archaeon]|jgi:MFS family permease
MKIRRFFMVVIPSMFTWCLASLLLLIYSFDILDYVENSEDNPFMGWGVTILAVLLIFIILALYITGGLLDTNPEYLKRGVIFGMLGSSIFSILFVVSINSALLFLICLIGLVFCFAILLTSSGTLFAGMSNVWSRGKVYSVSIFGFLLLVISSLFIGYGVSSQYASSDPLSMTWVIVIPSIGVLGLILTAIFYLLSRDIDKPWIPDAWPTKFSKIIGRRSVQAYLSTHFLLYCMLGISIAIFPQVGLLLDVSEKFVLELGEMQLTTGKVFWLVVLLGDLILVLPAGYLSDKFGRKNLIVLAIYGIVISAMILGLEKTELSFLISALIIGFSFALIHPTLDSSLWADLSPRDGLGRYFALGFMSLAFGLGTGYGIGHWILVPSLDNLDLITYLLIVLAIIAAFPLFWASDSYKPLDFTLLMVIEEGGLPLFDYVFQKKLETDIELTLLSGALTAVSSFMNETMSGDEGDLNLVRHGNHFILTDKDRTTGISTVIFSNKQDPELKKALREFQGLFCDQYGHLLKTWNGNRSLFDSAVDIAEEVFGYLAPSTNLEE